MYNKIKFSSPQTKTKKRSCGDAPGNSEILTVKEKEGDVNVLID